MMLIAVVAVNEFPMVFPWYFFSFSSRAKEKSKCHWAVGAVMVPHIIRKKAIER
jgi:hypothetical protein